MAPKRSTNPIAKLSYKELQDRAMNLMLPANLKHKQLLALIIARETGQERIVRGILADIQRERLLRKRSNSESNEYPNSPKKACIIEPPVNLYNANRGQNDTIDTLFTTPNCNSNILTQRVEIISSEIYPSDQNHVNYTIPYFPSMNTAYINEINENGNNLLPNIDSAESYDYLLNDFLKTSSLRKSEHEETVLIREEQNTYVTTPQNIEGASSTPLNNEISKDSILFKLLSIQSNVHDHYEFLRDQQNNEVAINKIRDIINVEDASSYPLNDLYFTSELPTSPANNQDVDNTDNGTRNDNTKEEDDLLKSLNKEQLIPILKSQEDLIIDNNDLTFINIQEKQNEVNVEKTNKNRLNQYSTLEYIPSYRDAQGNTITPKYLPAIYSKRAITNSVYFYNNCISTTSSFISKFNTAEICQIQNETVAPENAFVTGIFYAAA